MQTEKWLGLSLHARNLENEHRTSRVLCSQSISQSSRFIIQYFQDIILTCTSRVLGRNFYQKSAAPCRERAHLDVSGWTPAPPWCRLSLHPLLTHLAASYSHISERHSCFSTSCQPSDSQMKLSLYFGLEHHLIRAPSWFPAKCKCPVFQEVSSHLLSGSAGIFSPRMPGLSWLCRDKREYCSINMCRTETRWI